MVSILSRYIVCSKNNDLINSTENVLGNKREKLDRKLGITSIGQNIPEKIEHPNKKTLYKNAALLKMIINPAKIKPRPKNGKTDMIRTTSIVKNVKKSS